MQVTQYLFKSPSPQQVQVGRPDPTTKEESGTSDSTNSTQYNSVQAKTAAEIMTGQEIETPEVKPTVSTERLLDVYA